MLLLKFCLVLVSFYTFVLGNDGPEFKKTWSLNLEEKLGQLEYGQYLNDVFQLIEGASGFHERMIKEFNEEGLRTSLKTADDFDDLVPSDIRSKLDELKRVELQRLVKYASELRLKLDDEEIVNEFRGKLGHMDLTKADNFNPQDLRNLLNQTLMHLDVLEEIRKQSYKEYEMFKHLELQELLKRLSPEEKIKVESNMEELRKYHKRQPPMYIPLSRPHLLEVWEEMDLLNRENYNHRTFFHKHDLNGDGVLDEDEVKAFMTEEVDRYYNSADVDFDQRERDEELERMWEYIFNMVDTNKDRLIDWDEFLNNSKNEDMNDVEFWESLGNKPVYTKKEYEEYAKEHRHDVNVMIDEGKIKLPETGVVSHEKDGKASNPSIPVRNPTA